jgi:hypothetical protein
MYSVPRILQKLIDLGWGEELEKYPQNYAGLDQCPQVKQPKALSDRSKPFSTFPDMEIDFFFF